MPETTFRKAGVEPRRGEWFRGGMGYGFRESRQRARRRGLMLLAAAKWSLYAGIVLVAAYFAYVAGVRITEASTGNLGERVEELTAQLGAVQGERDRLKEALARASAQAEDLRKRYESDVPSGAISDLLGALRAKLSAGVAPARIAGVLAAVENTRACDDRPVTKRFTVRLGAGRGPTDSITFADRSIVVSATGTAATDANGRSSGWFDPAQPVTVTFTRLGGAESVVSGVLPLQHAIVIKDVEHRFMLAAGDVRGFIFATADSCTYP